jgi:hypothetical protein
MILHGGYFVNNGFFEVRVSVGVLILRAWENCGFLSGSAADPVRKSFSNGGRDVSIGRD